MFQGASSYKYYATYSFLLSSLIMCLYFSFNSALYSKALEIDIANAILTIITGSFDSSSNTSMKFSSNFSNLHKFSVIPAKVCRWTNFSLTPNPFTDSIAIC